MNGPDPRDEVRLNDGPDGTAAVRPPNAFRATTYNLCRGPAATAVRSYEDHTPGPGCVTKARVARNSLASARRQYAGSSQQRFARVLFPSRPAWISATDETGGETGVSGVTERLSGGALNAAIANEVGKVVADFTGRGATKSRAFVQQDLVVCVLEDGATRAERNLVAAGKADLVRVQRDALQRAMGPQLIAAVERLTSRKVRTFLSGMDEEGGSAIEAFLLEPEPPETYPAELRLTDGSGP